MAPYQTRKRLYSAVFRGIALLIVLLIGGLGYVQAVHVHQGIAPEQRSARSHCSLCVVTHSPAQVTNTAAGPVPALDSSPLAVTDPQLKSRLLVATSFIRPPPQSV